MSQSSLWLLLVAAGVGTLLLRVSFLTLLRADQLPDVVRRGLQLLPGAVLAGLAAPTLVPALQEVSSFAAWGRPAAMLIAFVVAWRWRNVLLTIGTGMVSLWILRWIV